MVQLRDVLRRPESKKEEVENALQQLHYIAFGTWGDVDSVATLQTQIQDNLNILLAADVWPLLYNLLIERLDAFLLKFFFHFFMDLAFIS